jgi:hypothetical protein
VGDTAPDAIGFFKSQAYQIETRYPSSVAEKVNMPSTDSGITKFLAVWGALLSSVTFGWTLYRDLRDRAKVQISAELRRIGRREGDGAFFTSAPDLPVQGASEKLFVVVSVVNVGRRPMRWKGLGGTYRDVVRGRKGFLVSARHLPRTLQEQEQHDEFFDFEEPFDQELAKGRVKRIYIWDVAGREWSVPRRALKRLAADAKKYSAAASPGYPA